MKCFTILLLVITTQICATLEISSKLDFDGAKLISTNTQHDVNIQKHASKREETKDFDGIGVVCVSEGCNKTKTDESKNDSIKTDVVVHVVTSVDVKKNKTNYVDDTPDVPIVIGVAGTKPNQGIETIYGPPKFSPPITIGNTYSIPNTYRDPYVGINVNTLPLLTGEMGYDKRRPNSIRYTNGLEIDSPHLIPPHNTHYFGESSPSQLGWYPIRRPATFNPVEFKNIPKTTWDLSYLNRKITPTFSYKIPMETSKTSNCNCKYHQGSGLQWQPSNLDFNKNDPVRGIDDKLAPLN